MAADRAARVRAALDTVRVRQTLLALAVVGLGLLAGGALVVGLVRHDLRAGAERQARDRAGEVVAQLRAGPPPAQLPAAGEDRAVVQVVAAGGRVLAASAELRGAGPVLAGDAGPRTVPGLPVGDGADYLVVGLPGGDPSVTVYAGSSLEPAGEAVGATVSALAVAVPLLLLGAGLASWRLVGRSLRPVEAIRREVAALTAQDLDRRVPEPAAADEIGRLARTMNGMLARLQQDRDRQRRFVEDASHELRSPLAAIRIQVEVGLVHPDRTDWLGLARHVHREGDRLEQLVGELLALSTGAGSAPVRQVDLDELVLTEMDSVRVRASVAVHLAALTPVRLLGRPEQLRLVVRNLLQNAERYAVARITVRLSAGPGSADLVVADDGPGVPPGERDRVFEPFYRLEQARDRASGGAGLGLAIVRDAVAAHGGAVWFDDVPAGAQAHVRLPTSG